MVGQEKKTPDADTGFVNQYRSTTCCGLLKQPDKHEISNAASHPGVRGDAEIGMHAEEGNCRPTQPGGGDSADLARLALPRKTGTLSKR